MRKEERLSPQEVLDKYKEWFTKSDMEKLVDMCRVAMAKKSYTEEQAIEARRIAYTIKAENELKTKEKE